MISLNQTVNKGMLKQAADELMCQGINLFGLFDDLDINMVDVVGCSDVKDSFSNVSITTIINDY